jgi:DNA-directed RNA polymerase alpha subunit
LGDLNKITQVTLKGISDAPSELASEFNALVHLARLSADCHCPDIAGYTRCQKIERLFIPPQCRQRPLSNMKMSKRLRDVLGFKGFKVLGDLHGAYPNDLRLMRNCGKRTLDELLSRVKSLGGGLTSSRYLNEPKLVNPRSEPVRFQVAANASRIQISDLLLSTRLRGVLRRLRIKRLGDLNSISYADLQSCGNFGRVSLTELHKVLLRVDGGAFGI